MVSVTVEKNITTIWVLCFQWECSFVLEETSWFCLYMQRNQFPPRITSLPFPSQGPGLLFSPGLCLRWMSNRHGTWCIQAGPCSGIVIPSYVCTSDVLLTSIDFLTRGTFSSLKKATLQEWKASLGMNFQWTPSFPFLWLLFKEASYFKCLNWNYVLSNSILINLF